MKQKNCLHGVLPCSGVFLAGALRPRQINVPLPEEDIIFLQDLFLTNGYHHIKVPSQGSGRIIMHTLLQSMHYYHNVACLTDNSGVPLKKSVTDLCDKITCNYLPECSYEDVETYFLEQDYIDFMWIELSESLFTNTVAMYVLQVLQELNLAQHIPIISLSFETGL
jgi:hypothetical protein